MKERPFLCDGCPIAKGRANLLITEASTGERTRKRKEDYLFGIVPKPQRVVILYAKAMDMTTSPAKGDRVRYAVNPGLRKRKGILNKILRCRGPEKGYNDSLRCPAITIIPPSRKRNPNFFSS